MTQSEGTMVEQVAPVVLEQLRTWRASGQALSRRALAHRCECSDRVLRFAVAELRRQGHLIIAEDAGGYRLAQTPEDVEAYVNTLKSRCQALREIIDRMQASSDRQFAGRQMGLFASPTGDQA